MDSTVALQQEGPGFDTLLGSGLAVRSLHSPPPPKTYKYGYSSWQYATPGVPGHHMLAVHS